jgi:hypothetical protein
MKVDNWLKDTEGIVIECEEDEITPYTSILVTPLYKEGVKSPKGSDGQRTMILKEIMKIKGRLIVKNSPKLLEYIQTRMGKEMFD